MNSKRFYIVFFLILSVTLNAQDWYDDDDNSDKTQQKERVSQNDSKKTNDAQLVTENLFVGGSCNMCKTRIETTVLSIQSVVSAKYNLKKQILQITFNPKITSLDMISKELAKVGHDTEKYKADLNTYDKLPNCCKYRK